nr:uncharacterized protein LOC104085742 [Nicotiana tomentosiformis]
MTVDTMSSLGEMDIVASAICKCDGLNCALYAQYFLGGFPGGTLIVDTETSMLVSLVRASTYYTHTVIDGVKRFIVCLQNRRCSCGQFQLDELPYPYALAALRHINESYENYCSPYYTCESLLQTY